MMSQGEKAIIAHNNALKISRNQWDRAASLIERASALNMLGRVEAAIQDYRSAIHIVPMKRSAYLPLAMCYRELNFLSKSEWYDFMKEIEDSINVVLDDETKRIKEAAILVDTHNIDAESSSVYWALYLSAEKAGYYEKAWSFLENAHDLDKTKKVIDFDPKEANIQRDSIISVFNRGFWPQNIGYPDATPVFIVGMMRSGSTLLETMLDAHDGIIGLGEDSIFNSNLPQFRDNLVSTIAKQDFVLVKDLVNNFGAKTISRMKSASQVFMNATEQKTITKMIDKMLFNYRNIGFIHLVYPNAVILHAMRDPMDTILSCYTHKFDDIGLTWSLNHEHLTQTYSIYLEIMHHFRTVLPNRIMDVSYEELVNTPEEVMRKVLTQLGLPWDQKVLEYHKRRRMVQTHSTAQVRKSIYKHSVGAWRKYLHNLIPAINSLKKHLKVLEERGALPYGNLVNWNLDPFYDYNDDFKFNISKAEYLKLLEEDELKRNGNKNLLSHEKDDFDEDTDIEFDEEEYPKKLKRRRAAKKQSRQKKRAAFVDDDGDVDFVDRTERLIGIAYDKYSSTMNKYKSLNEYTKKLKYKHENSQVNELIALGYILTNNDKIKQAIELFNSLILALKYDYSDSKLLVYTGLGEAYSVSNKFKEAIETFNLLIESDSNNIDGLFRRSELLRASGDLESALSDMNKVIKLGEDNIDVRVSRGLSFFELGHFQKASVDFKAALEFALRSETAAELIAKIYHLLGQCEKEFGEIEKSLVFHNRSIELMPELPDYMFAYAVTAADGGLWREALIFMNETLALNDGLKNVYGFRGLLYQNLGMASEAIIDLEKTITFDAHDINPLVLLGVSFQSLGKYDQAFKAFETILSIDRKNAAWFRKEFISYYVGKLDMDFKQFNLDNEFDPMIKEGLIESHTTAFIPKSYVPYGSITSMTYMRRQSIVDEPISQEISLLLNATKDMIVWTNIDSPGYLPHRRRQTSFRLCVLEIAQALKNHVSLLNDGKEGLIIPDKMSSNKDYYGVRSVKNGNHLLGWRDLYDIAVRWLQLSEPMDPIWWNDKLPKKRGSRVGSSTYISKGSLKAVKYSKYYDYTFNITRQYVANSGYYNQKDQLISLSDSEKQEALQATTIDELYRIVGKPFHLKVQCESSLYPGLFLDGTQISISAGEREGYDISISTVSTTERFIQYEEELHMTYRRLVSSLLARKREENTINAVIANDDIAIQNIVPALEMFYYWVNLSPLSRASASTGYIILFASILAQDEELTENLPKYKQLDWEAYFSENPRNFIKTISTWMLHRKVTTALDNDINISSIFKTPRDILNLLSKA